MPKLCICQICVCGRHRCPHKVSRDTFAKDKDEPEKFVTEMKQSYKCRPNQPKEQPLRPVHQLNLPKGQMNKASTTMEDYQAKKSVPREVKQKPQYKPPEDKMYTQTTYKKDYTVGDMSQWQAKEPTAKGKEPNIRIPNDKMEFRTTQNRDYILYDKKSADASRAKPLPHRGGTLTVLGQEFKGKSETMKAFKKPGPTDRIVGKKKSDNLHPEGQFEGKPTTAVDYPPRKCEARTKVKPKGSAMKWPDDVVNAKTTYKTDYPLHDKKERAKPCGPRKTQMENAEEPFSGKSSYKTDYPAHEAQPKSELPWQPKKVYEKPSVAFIGDTTYKKNFESPPEDLVPEKGKGMKNNLTLGDEPMATVTTHRTDYLPHAKWQPVKSFKTARQYAPPDTPFADVSTTRRDYKGDSGVKASPVKKEGNLHTDTGPMDLTTVTSQDYARRKFDCPAARLKQGDADLLEQYKYLDTNMGHEFYHKLKPSRKTKSN